MPTNVGFATLSTFVLLSSQLAVAQTVGAALWGNKNLEITNKRVSPDGFERMAVLAGGTLPGPLITTVRGGRFRINVVDKLTDRTMLKTTSIHWHGLFQKGTNWADGPSFINQCPIASGNSFLYDFPTLDQVNTFWYHSHHEAQYCDGLRGPMVVYDPFDAHRRLYDVDDESTIITLMDWFHVPAPQVRGGTPPDSTLINGKGRYLNGPAAPLSVINVVRGRRYRMRLINMACDPNYTFSIDGHTELNVIETDGISNVPQTVDSIQIFVAQRHSFVLNANQPIGNYWIRANPNVGPQGFAGGLNSAILRYKGAKNEDPKSVEVPSARPMVESRLAPIERPAAPGVPRLGAADVNIRFELGFAGGNFTMNGVKFESPSVPVLLQILSGARNAQDILPRGSVYPLPRDKVVEITIANPGAAPGAPHPFHLHGHAFSIVKGSTDTEPNFKNPPRRDVVSSGVGNSTVVLRFKTDNAGPWLFHCHIEFHLVAGLAVVFAEDTPRTDFLNPTPKAWDKLCPIYEALPESEL
ncbi:laccase [Pterulicium gracile]|uniref:Laccase n=1 Tax=Pterulicium gracile TaxID=1884261 RepID=A0A5C3QRH7_9AGAR|nr:laccase [Pterula gracilis]